MKRQQNEFNARAIIAFFQENTQNQLATVKHFRQQNIKERTIRNVISRFLKTGVTDYRPIPGRKPVVNTPRIQRKVLKHAKKNRSLSERVSSKQLHLSRSTYQRVKEAVGLRSRKKQRKPKYNKGQIQRAIKWSAKLYKDSLPSGKNYFFVLDDETYVPLDPTQVPGNQYYLSDDEAETPVKERVVQTGKFEKRFMIWQAMAEDGSVSEPFVTNGTVNGEIYLKECIEKRLLPFLRKVDVQRPILFWPDLATSHYCNIVTAKLREEGVNFVSKEQNPPNVPQLRPIEKFWALCKHKYHMLNKAVDSIPKMKRIWTRISKEIAAESGKNLFKHFRQKLRTCSEKGPLSV